MNIFEPKVLLLMTDMHMVRGEFEKLNVCVIIPTYNNAGTLRQVLSDVSEYTSQIILVNDGSTDETRSIAGELPLMVIISYDQNRGKGWALRQGLAEATARNFRYAIAMDSDGQHFASDLPRFLEKIAALPDALIIGSRNMDHASVPGKSSFGHKFSNFWFKVESGIDCPDTQSGFRLYPLHPLKEIRLLTRKYELEIEVLVKLAWMGVPIASVPISVYYAPKETRISHFRPFIDITRISILNTFLVVIAFLYIKPRNFMRGLFKKKTLNSFSAKNSSVRASLTR